MTVIAGTWYHVECDGCAHSALDDDDESILWRDEAGAIDHAIDVMEWSRNTAGMHCPNCSDLYNCRVCGADCDVDQVEAQTEALDPDNEEDQKRPYEDELCFACWLADNPVYTCRADPDVPDAQLTLPQLPVKVAPIDHGA